LTRSLGVSAALAIIAVIAVSCRDKEPEPRSKYDPQRVSEIAGVSAEMVQAAIIARIDSANPPSWVTPERWKKVRALYAHYSDAPLWIQSGGVKDRATALLAALDSAPTHALKTDRYPLDSIHRVVDAQKIDSGAKAADIANADVALTAAYVGYASDMLVGQVDPRTVSQSWYIPARPAAVDSALVHTLEDSSMSLGLEAMAPQDSEYAVLRKDYVLYRGFAAQGGWPETYQGVSKAELRSRLEAEGYVISGDSVVSALKRWQERHDLAPDGKIGKATFAALNVTADERVEQIATNLERHRWLPRALGQRYVYVNVPSFRLDAYDSGQRALSMRVIVGADYKEKSTPVFSDVMRTVVFRPYWRPTKDIITKEILPKIKTDTTFLRRNDMEWATESGTRVLRQRPGPRNSLGLVKFLFPNDYNIYLHDTNEKSLFGKSVRAESHGCIRVQHPDSLAEFVLGWTADSVTAAMQAGKDNRAVTLPQKLPVYIVYFTAYARDGDLHFANDVYKRDSVFKAPVPSAP
jgi:murein L,D-transpeptidase YcbB/YkuD